MSNGAIRQQEAKIRMTGLDRYVADWVISEEVGIGKPDPRIFRLAAERARMPFHDAWMIGDSPNADIGGAIGARDSQRLAPSWPPVTEPRFTPTVTADSPISALAAILGNARC